jgi:hypothetical protein
MVLKIRLNMAATATAMVTAMGMVLIQMDILMRRNHNFYDAIKKNYKQKEKNNSRILN